MMVRATSRVFFRPEQVEAWQQTGAVPPSGHLNSPASDCDAPGELRDADFAAAKQKAAWMQRSMNLDYHTRLDVEQWFYVRLISALKNYDCRRIPRAAFVQLVINRSAITYRLALLRLKRKEKTVDFRSVDLADSWAYRHSSHQNVELLLDLTSGCTTLSPHLQQVVHHLRDGHSLTAIATRLGISVSSATRAQFKIQASFQRLRLHEYVSRRSERISKKSKSGPESAVGRRRTKEFE